MLNSFIKPIINIHAIFGERCEFLRKRSFFFIKSILNEEKKRTKKFCDNIKLFSFVHLNLDEKSKSRDHFYLLFYVRQCLNK